MQLPEIAVMAIVLAAAAWLAFRVWKALRRKDCGSGCGACGSIDFAKIEAQIRASEAKKRN